jgi:hypothetical protein
MASLVCSAGSLAHAGFDGFSIHSSTFANQYQGNQVYDGATFQNQWVHAGGADVTTADLSLNGTNLVVNQTSTNGWFQHDDGTTPWEMGSGSWTVEVRAHVKASGTGISGFNIWGALNGQRDILIVREGGVTNLAGTSFDSTINTDGFHDFRLVYDAAGDAYHYFRDAVQITPAAGIPQQAGTGNTRLIIGDCCSNVAGSQFGGNGSMVEYEYIRYDMTGAYSPTVDSGAITLTINRDTGEISLVNTSGSAVSNIIGYSLLSPAGGLSQAGWDQQNGSSQLANDDDVWTVLTAAGGGNDLSEAVLSTTGAADGGNLVATSGTWTFGNVWRKSPFEDVGIELLLDDGTVLVDGTDFAVTYTGNGGNSFAVGDMDLDGDVDPVDWETFKGLYRGSDLSALGAAADNRVGLYQAGDLTGDGVYSLADFQAFQSAYDAANGAGAFQAAVASVPEPGAWMLLVFAGTTLLGHRRGGKTLIRSNLLIVPLAVFALTVAQSQPVVALTPLDSSNFDNRYNGNEIWNGTSFVNQWAQAGGATPAALSLNGTNLVQTNDANNGWIQHDDADSTPWELGSGSFTVEMTAVLNDTNATLNDGFTLWAELGGATTGNRQILWIQNDSVNLLDGTELLGGIDNTDTLHTYRLAYDATDTSADATGTYHVWRDGLLITGSGIARQAAATVDSRLIAGDCCTSLGNPVDQYEIGYIRYDMDGAFEPEFLATLELHVNTTTGAVSIVNNGSPIEFSLNSYEITSASGSLVAGNWNSLESQDVSSDPTPGDKDNGDSWEEFDNVDANFVGEGYLLGSTPLANGNSFSLGRIWNTSGGDPLTDLSFSFTASNGGFNQGVVVLASGGLDGDLDGDNDVDGSDFLLWQRGFGSTFGAADLADFEANFGTSGSVAAAAAVPEPGTGLLGVLGSLVAGAAARRRRLLSVSCLAPLAAMLLLAGSATASQIDRDYTLGDDPAESASANATVGAQTFDSAGTPGQGDLQDVNVLGSPVYRSVSGATGRPGAAAGDLGIEFDGMDDVLYTAISMNAPTQMWDNDTFFPGPPPQLFPHNYEGIFSHGIQLWAKPTVTGARQDLVYDTTEHGIGITANNTWALGYDKNVLDSGVTVASTLDANGWAHVMQLSGFGDPVGGGSAQRGALLVNGVAVRAASTFYDPSTLPLSIGASLTLDGSGQPQNTTNFYKGQLDDVRIFFWGDNSDELGDDGAVGGTNTAVNSRNADGQNWGPLDLSVDNDWIRQRLATLGVTDPADVDLSGGAVNAADEAAFRTHWRKVQTINNVQVGDWNSRQQGDLNYDGIVNLGDAFILHEALQAAGLSGLNFAALGGVPEPSACALLLAGLACWGGNRRRHR